eukprot:UN11882
MKEYGFKQWQNQETGVIVQNQLTAHMGMDNAKSQVSIVWATGKIVHQNVNRQIKEYGLKQYQNRVMDVRV